MKQKIGSIRRIQHICGHVISIAFKGTPSEIEAMANAQSQIRCLKCRCERYDTIPPKKSKIGMIQNKALDIADLELANSIEYCETQCPIFNDLCPDAKRRRGDNAPIDVCERYFKTWLISRAKRELSEKAQAKEVEAVEAEL